MLVDEKEKKIKEKILEITGRDIDILQQINYDLVKNIRVFNIKKILLISSSYDYFSIEEEGRLNKLFQDACSFDSQSSPASIIHLESGREAVKKIKNEHFDLIVIFNDTVDISIDNLSKQINEITSAPLVLLGNDIAELTKILKKNQEYITKAFTWNGDGKIILSIVQYFEDKVNIRKTSDIDYKKIILLIEDSIQHYSGYLSLINEEICNFLENIITDDLSAEQKLIRYKRRPFVIHTDNYSEAIDLFNKYKEDIIGIISDNHLKDKEGRKEIGVQIARQTSKSDKRIPVLIQSSEPIKAEEIKNKDVKFISKSSHNRRQVIRKFIKQNIGNYKITINDEEGKTIFKIKTINDFKQAINKIDGDTLLGYAKNNHFSNWLKNIGEIELANKLSNIQKDSSKEFINNLKNLLEDYIYSINQSSISSFSRKNQNTDNKLSRIGSGALGGKARGIAFVAKLLSKYIPEDLFANLKITIPRSIILSTDIFDFFMDYNALSDLDFSHLSDQRITSKFIEKPLPATILGDLRDFIKKTRKPLIVRSSGLLEDSLMQPFAGIYESLLLPNESWETDTRFQEVCNAVKFVYSSTYFEKARTYIKNTPKHIGDERMAVLIQEVAGMKHENYFYPIISGVAKSYNYYPQGPCNSEQGIVYLALGLGKSIVDGGSSFAFCPEKPKVPLFGTPKAYMKYAQRKYYALNLKSIHKFSNFNEETTLDKLDIETLKEHEVLENIASTYIYQDDQLYPGLYEEGNIVIDFAPILHYESIPMVKAINLLLKISEIALGYPVEIEFALNISKKDSEPSELIILQIRNMIPPEKNIEIDINQISKQKTKIFSKNALGNGIISDIYNIVYVDQDCFDLSNSNTIVNQIREINKKLMDENLPYILIGPGRWGSTDPWLGIPVIWSEIAGARVIVETPYKERHIDPSQGSHFFHDMMAAQVVYLITKKENDIDWEWFKKQKILQKTEFLKHIQLKKPLKAIVDGKIGKGVIIKQNEKISGR